VSDWPSMDSAFKAGVRAERERVKHIIQAYKRLFEELRDAVEECDPIKHDGDDEFIPSYLLSTGPWHRVLAKARAGVALGVEDSPPKERDA
jgi:hypothetical protein